MQAHGPPMPAVCQARESMRRPSRRQRTRCGRRRGQSGAHPIESAACPLRRDGRVVECAGLEIRYTVIPYRGFESLSLRHSFQAGRIPLRHSKSPGKGLFCCLESGKSARAALRGRFFRTAKRFISTVGREIHFPVLLWTSNWAEYGNWHTANTACCQTLCG